jgi:fructosamine-3-kinase
MCALSFTDLIDPRPVSGGDSCRALSARTPDGDRVFAKTLTDPPAGFFEAEAAGLDRLRVAGGPPVPRVRAVSREHLVLDWVEPAGPSAAAALRFGRALATLHRSSASAFGAQTGGYVGTVALDNSPTRHWPEFYAGRRLAPALSAARQRRAITPDQANAIEEVISRVADLAEDDEPPALVHGDLWAGNLLWAAGETVWLVDGAAAHHGHRETDLAMLALFGAPHLAEIADGYDQVYPRAAGWQSRVALHQVHPLLVHAVLFGGGYAARAATAAREALQ